MHDHAHHHSPLTEDARAVLLIVLLLNFSMFVFEAIASMIVESHSLLVDSIDFLGDSATYAISLYALNKPLAFRAKVSLLKAAGMLAFAAFVIANAFYHILHPPSLPDAFTMGKVALLALVVNVQSAFLLFSIRKDDSNTLSAWLCSRNDAIANVLVIIAAVLVQTLHHPGPDLLAAVLIAGLALTSALRVIAQARQELAGERKRPA